MERSRQHWAHILTAASAKKKSRSVQFVSVPPSHPYTTSVYSSVLLVWEPFASELITPALEDAIISRVQVRRTRFTPHKVLPGTNEG